jgi:hypothetical protein
MNTNTLCVYDGPSLVDGVRTIVLVTGFETPSINTKTGDMLQAYILRADMSPSEAVKIGADETVCGNCAMRPILVALAKTTKPDDDTIACYVDKVRGPDGAWQSNNNGNVEHVTPSEAAKRIAELRRCPGPCAIASPDPYAPELADVVYDCKLAHTHLARPDYPASGHNRKRCAKIDHATDPLGLRDGAYGDPASVERRVWDELHIADRKRTSYTHQWESSPHMADIAMASIDPQTHPDTDAALALAASLNFRTYRVLAVGEQPRKNERMCPESTSNGKISCADCGECDGNARATAKGKQLLGITIPAIR